ncbi:MAG: SIMPL domain-containing protein [Terracidiphilus sp.]|jgi:uncharacterized protein YggE
MTRNLLFFAFVAACACVATAQPPTQAQLKIESANRTLTVSAEERVTADPEIAILHIGFETPLSDAKTAYAAGAKTSNDIVTALKNAGIPEASIRSENQHLQNELGKAHRFKLVQQWTVKAPPDRAAEILDVAVGAGATDSGQIDWTMQDVRALEDQALDRAAARVKANADVLAKGMGVHLGPLVYVTNQVSGPQFQSMANFESNNGAGGYITVTKALAIEPRKVSRTASVYAVFAIE